MNANAIFDGVMDAVARVIAVGLFFIWGSLFFIALPAYTTMLYQDWYFKKYYGQVRQVTQDGHYWSISVVRFLALLGWGTIGITVLRVFDAAVLGYVITKGWCNIFGLSSPDPATNLLWWLS